MSYTTIGKTIEDMGYSPDSLTEVQAKKAVTTAIQQELPIGYDLVLSAAKAAINDKPVITRLDIESEAARQCLRIAAFGLPKKAILQQLNLPIEIGLVLCPHHYNLVCAMPGEYNWLLEQIWAQDNKCGREGHGPGAIPEIGTNLDLYRAEASSLKELQLMEIIKKSLELRFPIGLEIMKGLASRTKDGNLPNGLEVKPPLTEEGHQIIHICGITAFNIALSKIIGAHVDMYNCCAPVVFIEPPAEPGKPEGKPKPKPARAELSWVKQVELQLEQGPHSHAHC